MLAVAGAYGGPFDMGVAADARRRGIGLALTRAAVSLREAGCRLVALNAAAEGEPLYHRAGFPIGRLGRDVVMVPSLARRLGA